MIVRQGDVLIRTTESVPSDAQPVEREGGRVVLAHGEVTGHAHAITTEQDADAMLLARGDIRFLTVNAPVVVLRHEEHAPIELPAGNYEVVVQREYSPEQVRNVAD